MEKPRYWSLAKKTLSKKDKVIKKIIATHSGSLVSRSDPFFSLCRSYLVLILLNTFYNPDNRRGYKL